MQINDPVLFRAELDALLAAGQNEDWHLRHLVFLYLQQLFYRHVFLLTDEIRDLIALYIIDALSDSQVRS